MSELDKVWADAVAYIESLGDKRTPSIHLYFHRTEDFRRACMNKNKSPLISFMAEASIKKLSGDPPEPEENQHWKFFKGFNACPYAAINEAIDGVKAWLEGGALHPPTCAL